MLGVFLTLGTSSAAIHANDMAVEMAMTADMGGSGHGGCNGCDDGAAAPGACLSVCVAPAFAVLPPAVSVEAAEAEELSLRKYLVLAGKASTPDPYPPRPADLV